MLDDEAAATPPQTQGSDSGPVEGAAAPGGDSASAAEVAPDLAPVENWHWHHSHLAARAGAVSVNASGGIESFDLCGPNPVADLPDPYLDGFLAHQQLEHGLSGLLMIITRTDNNNMVVYQANVAGPGELGTPPIHTFWFDVEPSYVRKRRKKGNVLDRVEFGIMDPRGYGLNISQRNGTYYCSMAAMPAAQRQEFTVVWVDGNPRLVGRVGGSAAYIEKLYIQTRKRTMNPIPAVLSVQIWGTAVTDGSKLLETIQI